MRRPRTHPFVSALRRRLSEDGPRAAARFLGERLRAQVYERERHLVLVKDLSSVTVPARRGNVRVEDLERRHLPALSELNRHREDRTGDARFAGDLANGYAGFVAFDGDDLVGCYWWCDATMPPHREFQEVARGVELGPGDVYGTDFHVDERHRKGGTAMDFLFQIETRLGERGYERLWGTVDATNRLARWTYGARGYEERWAVVGTRVLRHWRSRVAPLDSPTAEQPA